MKSVVNFQTINSPVAGDVGDSDVVRARDVEDVRDVRDVREVRARDVEDVRNRETTIEK